MEGEYENPEGYSGRRIDLSRRSFLLVTFLWTSKEKACPEPVEGSLGRGSGRKPWLYRKSESNVHGSPLSRG
jgi:hypothetical protein